MHHRKRSSKKESSGKDKRDIPGNLRQEASSRLQVTSASHLRTRDLEHRRYICRPPTLTCHRDEDARPH